MFFVFFYLFNKQINSWVQWRSRIIIVVDHIFRTWQPNLMYLFSMILMKRLNVVLNVVKDDLSFHCQILYNIFAIKMILVLYLKTRTILYDINLPKSILFQLFSFDFYFEFFITFSHWWYIYLNDNGFIILLFIFCCCKWLKFFVHFLCYQWCFDFH